MLPHNSWLDLAAYRYPYDFGPFNIADRPAEERERFWTNNKAARTAILRFRMDEHHYKNAERASRKDVSAGPTSP